MSARLKGRLVAVVLAIALAALPHAASPLSVREPTRWVDLAARPSGDGYWVTSEAGHVAGFAGALTHGDASRFPLQGPIVGITATPSGGGYWLAAADGGVFAFGDAAFRGSAASFPLAAPIRGIDRTPSGNGYWLLGADGGIFAFGDAAFLGRPIILDGSATGLAASPVSQGYFVVFGDGGPGNFGAATVPTSQGVSHGEPFIDVASTPGGTGAWLAEVDGRVFPHGDAAAHGDASSFPLQGRITSIAATSSGRGYWLLGEDGGVFAFGDARYHGRAFSPDPIIVID